MKKKKLSKIIFLTMAMFFAITISKSVSAREMTVEELGKELDKIEKSSQQNIDSYYVIGEHVFTSRYTLNTRDIMFAARSISMTNEEINTTNKDNILKEMTIYRVQRDFGAENKWNILSNYVGDSKLESSTKLKIHYIDYDYVYEEVNTDKLLKDVESKVQTKDRYTAKFDEGTQRITFKILDRNAKIGKDEIAKILVELLKQQYVKDIKIGDQSILKSDATAEGSAEDTVWKKVEDALETLTSKEDPNVLLGDLIGKEINLTIELDEKLARSHKGNKSENYTVEFTYNSVATLSKDIPEADKEELKSSFNYHIDEENDNYTVDGKDGDYKISGEIIEREKIKGFGGEKNGFYVPFAISLNSGIDPSKVKIKLPKSDKDGYNEFDNADGKLFTEGKITLLLEVEDQEDVKTRDIIIIVDDVETKIRIDFTELKLKKTSKFTVEALSEDYKTKFEVDEDGSWYDKDNGYNVEVSAVEGEDDKYKVTGVLPIFDDEGEEWNDEDNIFNSGKENLYYLGLLLKLVNAPEGYNKDSNDITVKFFHNENEEDKQFMEVDGDDFENKKELYILKALCEVAQSGDIIPDEEKVFTITVDLDGDGDEYAPHTVTIDWSGLKLQAESTGDFGSYDIVSSADSIKEDTNAVADLKKYGYSYDADNGVKIKDGERQEESGYTPKAGLEGEIKQQTLKDDAGFKEDEGYYVPIKVEFPGKEIEELEDYKEKWTIILNTEGGQEKEYTPTSAEYEQGWVVVLFKIDKTGKDGKKEITYKIDYDGLKEKAFVPCEYKIDYSSLQFKSANTITYKYTDNEGKEQTETVNTYQDEEVKLKELTEDETDYRKLDGWYKETGKTKVEGETYTTGEDEDVTLEAHWNLNTEKFVEEVVEDLNEADTTYSKDFTEKFSLEQDENTITINVKKPNVPLTELAETSIPGAIAYVLEKGEIKDITLNVGSQTKTFSSTYTDDGGKDYDQTTGKNLLTSEGESLRKEIVKGAKKAFDDELENHEDAATLDGLEYKDKTFTLKIGEPKDDTVKLVKDDGSAVSSDDDKTYTFKFDSDFVVVDQDDATNLNEKSIDTAISSDKKYSTVYIDGDYTASDTVTITAQEGTPVEIKAVDSGIAAVSATSEPTTKIEVTNDKETAVDVKSGTVTISDLKLTGGKKSQLKIEDGATVTADNIDVSGKINSPGESEDGRNMTASILVEGTLNASNIKNSDESYIQPTIALVTGDFYPGAVVGGEDEESGPSKDGLHPNAKVTVTNMTKNERYSVIDKTDTKIHKIKETYYGSFYYNEKNNSQIYFLAIMDLGHKEGPYDYIQVYYYGDKIDFVDKIGYKVGETEDDTKNQVLKNFKIKNGGEILGNGTENAQDLLSPHTTNVVYAYYENKPVANVKIDESSGLSANGNKISGTIKTQSDGKFMIPVTLTSENFQDNVSTVKVTDPNGTPTEYKYSSTSDNGIATVSTEETKKMKLNLEAIKTNKITGSNGKEYTITVDVDGDGEKESETYTVNYDGVKTEEEIINEAAERTQKATSFTIEKDNKIKSGTEKYKFEIDNAKKLKLYTEGDGESKKEQYSFPRESVEAGNDTKEFVVVEKSTEMNQTDRPKLNGWTYFNQFDALSDGTHELGLLKDVIKKDDSGKIDEENSIYALTTIEKEEDHKYKVTVSEEKLGSWLNLAYIDYKNEETTMGTTDKNKTVTLEVTLDNNDQYITELKTTENFSITKDNVTYSDNKINVKFSNIGSTTVKAPQQMLGESEEKNATNDEIKEFIKKGRDWWNKKTGSQSAQG